MMKWISLTAIMLALFCWRAFEALGSRVDADGQLHEAFFLIPLGWFFLLVGVVAGVSNGIICLLDRVSRR